MRWGGGEKLQGKGKVENNQTDKKTDRKKDAYKRAGTAYRIYQNAVPFNTSASSAGPECSLRNGPLR